MNCPAIIDLVGPANVMNIENAARKAPAIGTASRVIMPQVALDTFEGFGTRGIIPVYEDIHHVPVRLPDPDISRCTPLVPWKIEIVGSGPGECRRSL